MHFSLVDRILELELGRRIVAVKNLSLAEEYLADHFPQFPVMPGVLMLEAMVQAGAWLVRATEDFQHSMVILRQANNIKYGRFVEPGQSLQIEAEILGQTEEETRLKAQGTVDGQFAVGGRLVLVRYNLADSQPHRKYADDWVRKELRKKFYLLYPPAQFQDSVGLQSGP
ncbi:MAG: beta-hydroxyacyl-ACP dehydratase [Thermoguttaceae bacterium]|nr:beta-hydroxyacyl-ACP dehydratase [Thermoguttaceae bacterium]MDW8036768.1 3-hydroxyacyl-ACP dehydratase FabZ family protein [Thermoguttaceae bacterium]